MLLLNENASDYPLKEVRATHDFYDLQAKEYDPITERFLAEAGLERDMGVVEIGTGLGHVARIAAKLVGPAGWVIGVDSSPEAIEAAAARTKASGLTNITYLCANAETLKLDARPGAVIGRLTMMYVRDPPRAFRNFCSLTGTGGLLAFQEIDYKGARSSHDLPLWNRVGQIIRETFSRVGANTEAGLSLYSNFREAGLPSPCLRIDALIGGGDAFPGPALAAGLVRAMLPAIRASGAPGSDGLDVETLQYHLRAELTASGGVFVLPALIGAWARVPGGVLG